MGLSHKKFEEPIMMIGNLNMVELTKNIVMNWGRIIAGFEKHVWNKCKNYFNLVDIGVVG